MAVSTLNISPVIIGSKVSLVNADLTHDTATCVTNVFLFSCNPPTTSNNDFLNKSGNSDLQNKILKFLQIFKSCLHSPQPNVHLKEQITICIYFNMVLQKEN